MRVPASCVELAIRNEAMEIGRLTAGSNEFATWLDFPRESFPEVPAHARFPRGLPDAMQP